MLGLSDSAELAHVPAGLVWVLLVPGADWLAHHDVGSARGSVLATARDAARGRLLTLGAGLLAAGALWFTARNFTVSRRTFELTEQGQVTDRYTKAVEQLGSDKLAVRIGGIYALERVARDSVRDHPTVMEVLTAFIREHSREPWPPPPDSGRPEQERSTRPDVQAAVTAVGRRETKREIGPIDLTRANLNGANLNGANLSDAILIGANLEGADLDSADLTGAALTEADLTGAHFRDATLTGANLAGAYLIHADLIGANLTGAYLSEATLADTYFTRANLTRAFLGDANLAGANLAGANLAGATLTGTYLNSATLTAATLTRADFTRADLLGIRWPTGVPVPVGWAVNGGSGRLERRGALSEVMTLSDRP